MAVMPRDQMSHSSLYPPFRATAATSGAILGVETLREPGMTQEGGRETPWCGELGEEESEKKKDTERARCRENHKDGEKDENKDERQRQMGKEGGRVRDIETKRQKKPYTETEKREIDR